MSGRRVFLQGAGAAGAAVVFGFDASRRRWVSRAEARHGSPFDRVPSLDGELVTDPTSLAAAAHDVGDIVHDTPVAVLRPGSVEDIQAMIRFCRRLCIKAAARGQGHTTFGQAQVEGGLVIEMATLNAIHSLRPGAADVDAGLKWIDLLRAAVPQAFGGRHLRRLQQGRAGRSRARARGRHRRRRREALLAGAQPRSVRSSAGRAGPKRDHHARRRRCRPRAAARARVLAQLHRQRHVLRRLPPRAQPRRARRSVQHVDPRRRGRARLPAQPRQVLRPVASPG